MKPQTVWLSFEDGDQLEHHMRWEGHESLETAQAELDYIFDMIMKGGGSPPNTYIYAADEPKWGYPEEQFDLGEYEKVFADLNKIQ